MHVRCQTECRACQRPYEQTDGDYLPVHQPALAAVLEPEETQHTLAFARGPVDLPRRALAAEGCFAVVVGTRACCRARAHADPADVKTQVGISKEHNKCTL